MYQWLASIAQSFGAVYFVALFALVVAYALWPKNRAKFERAANVPLDRE
jgi:cytochrome c oxidase cbb3-type subunit 4